MPHRFDMFPSSRTEDATQYTFLLPVVAFACCVRVRSVRSVHYLHVHDNAFGATILTLQSTNHESQLSKTGDKLDVMSRAMSIGGGVGGAR